MKRRAKKINNVLMDTLVGPNTTIEGTITSECSIRVDGAIQGRIVAKGAVEVGIEGKVTADIHAETVIVAGQVTGNIHARGKLEITKTGRVTGDIKAAAISVSEGGLVNGACQMAGALNSSNRQLEQDTPAGDPSDLHIVKSSSAH